MHVLHERHLSSFQPINAELLRCEANFLTSDYGRNSAKFFGKRPKNISVLTDRQGRYLIFDRLTRPCTALSLLQRGLCKSFFQRRKAVKDDLLVFNYCMTG